MKGHNNNEFNEISDCYANMASQVINPKPDLIENQDDKNKNPKSRKSLAPECQS